MQLIDIKGHLIKVKLFIELAVEYRNVFIDWNNVKIL